MIEIYSDGWKQQALIKILKFRNSKERIPRSYDHEMERNERR